MYMKRFSVMQEADPSVLQLVGPTVKYLLAIKNLTLIPDSGPKSSKAYTVGAGVGQQHAPERRFFSELSAHALTNCKVDPKPKARTQQARSAI